MKKTFQGMALLGLIALCASFNVRAEQPKSSKRTEPTVWVAPKTGSLIGGGYAASGETRIQPRTIAREKPSLRHAIEFLDGQGDIVVRGVGLVPTAVSWQTKVPVRTLYEQQAATHLSYGELLIVNSLAEGSGKSFNEILALRAKTKSWGELSLQLHINPDSIQARAEAASGSITYAEARSNRRREQNMRDAGLDARHLQNPQAAPHPFGTSNLPGGG